MGTGDVICTGEHSCKPAVTKGSLVYSRPHLSRQNVRLNECIDGRQAAVLVAGPPGADSVSFVLYS